MGVEAEDARTLNVIWRKPVSTYDISACEALVASVILIYSRFLCVYFDPKNYNGKSSVMPKKQPGPGHVNFVIYG